MTNGDNGQPANDEQMEWTFVVAKTKEGRIALGNVDGSNSEREPTLDDIYSALSIVQRDLQVQQTVGALGQYFAAVGAPGQTQSGLVVPEPTSKFKKVTRQ